MPIVAVSGTMWRGAFYLFVSTCTALGAARMVQTVGEWVHLPEPNVWGGFTAAFVWAAMIAYFDYQDEK